MKNFLTRRILILFSMVLIISSIIIASTGMFLAEGLIGDIKEQVMIPDISMLSECTNQYINGSISEKVYMDIINNTEKNYSKKITIYKADGSVSYQTSALKSVEKKELDTVLAGGEFFNTRQKGIDAPVVIVGLPIYSGEKISGAVFVEDELIDILVFRKRFLVSLAKAIVIVLPIVVMLTYFMLLRIIKPIKNVAAVAISLIKGDFSIRADETQKGEIGLLGKTINKLSVDLYTSISALFVEKNRLAQVLNSLDEGMLAVDTDIKITHFNPAFTKLCPAFDEAKELEINDIPFLDNIYKDIINTIDEKNTNIKKIEYQGLILRTIISPIENEKNKVVGAVIVFRDVTEYEKLENTRKEYVANVSHELRSPLTSIRGLIEPLKDGIVNQEQDKIKYYDIIYRETLRLSRLIDDIMELSRLQTSNAIIEKTEFSLKPLLEMVYERYKLIDEKIELIYNEAVLPKVYSNYDRIEQIVVILLDNAFKFTQEGGKVILSAEQRDNKVIISIKDSGVGISKEDKPHVFERFYKSDKARTGKGTGLGLSIAKEILALMGEEIYVKSEQNQGSEFCFTVEISNKTKA